MKNKKNLWNFTLIVIFFTIGFFLIYQTSPNPPANIKNDIKHVEIAGQNIKVVVAQTREELAQGLSSRNELKEDEGMLFIFERPGNYPFWMKDMNFPIDIIWMSGELEVVYIKNNARPELYPETYRPDAATRDTKYVLEVIAGFSEKHNLQIGDRVKFSF